MNGLQRTATALLTLALAGAVVAGAWWLVTHKNTSPSGDKPTPPATVNKVLKEDELNIVTLTEEAEKRIGLTVGSVVKKPTRRTRVYGGEVTVPVGRTILVVAPLAGTLKAPPGEAVQAGQAVKRGQVIWQLTPLLTPDGRATLSAALAEADGQANNAKTQVELSKIALERAKRVFNEGAGSQRQVDEAQAAFDLATKTLDATLTRLGILKKVVGDADAGTAAPIALEAPAAGILRTVSALAGQNVPSGAALFEVIDLTTAWVRVPIPVGDIDGIVRTDNVQIGKLAASPGQRLTTAKPVLAPPSANPLAATVDLFYELPNATGALFPGQRLGVMVPLAEEQEGSVLPWSAVVFDIHGSTWTYEALGTRRYARRRVTVSHTVGNDAVLSQGPPVGTKMVLTGVQELFGAETGFVK